MGKESINILEVTEGKGVTVGRMFVDPVIKIAYHPLVSAC